MSTTIRERLIRDLPKDEDFRYEYDEAFSNTYISSQIRALREDRKMTQSELAKAAKTGQSQISEMETDYDSWSLRTLRKLARPLGVRLFVTFESWSELIPKVEGFRREGLLRPEIENDPVFRQEPTSNMSLAAHTVASAPATAALSTGVSLSAQAVVTTTAGASLGSVTTPYAYQSSSQSPFQRLPKISTTIDKYISQEDKWLKIPRSLMPSRVTTR